MDVRALDGRLVVDSVGIDFELLEMNARKDKDGDLSINPPTIVVAVREVTRVPRAPGSLISDIADPGSAGCARLTAPAIGFQLVTRYDNP